jgi:MFS family permease
MDMVSRVLPTHKRTMGVSLHSLVRRVPMALGPVLGGLLIGLYGERDGVRLAFAAALILGAASLVLQQLMITEERCERKAEGNPLRALRLMGPSLRRLLVSDILVRFCEQIPYAFVALWCVSLHRITPVQFGLLTAIEMTTAMLVYIPVAYLADRSTKKPFVVATFCFFTIFPLVLLVSRSFSLMVVAFVIRGLKEFGEPTRKALIMDLAPEGRKAGTFGVYYLLRDAVVSLAAFGGALLWDPSATAKLFDTIGVGRNLLPWFESVASPTTNLLTAFGFGLLGTVYFALFGKDLKATPEHEGGTR